jgi:hypothetical protein
MHEYFTPPEYGSGRTLSSLYWGKYFLTANKLNGPSIINTQHNEDTISQSLNYLCKSRDVHLETSQ